MTSVAMILGMLPFALSLIFVPVLFSCAHDRVLRSAGWLQKRSRGVPVGSG